MFIKRLDPLISLKSVVPCAPPYSSLPVSAEGPDRHPGKGCTISVTYFFLLPLMTWFFAQYLILKQKSRED